MLSNFLLSHFSPRSDSPCSPAHHRALQLLPLALLCLLGSLALTGPAAHAQASETPPADPPATDDPRAVEVAQRLLEALGGQDAWDATRYLSFRFFGRHDHLWDKATGRHRLEGETREGQRFTVIHDIDDRGEGEGSVWLDGQEVTGERRRQLLQNAYAAWINDTYWLVMPYKLRDPGVTLAYDGTQTIGDQTYDVVQLSFDGVGLTPGDRYWAYVNRDTGLMDRWAYHLQSMGPQDEPTAWEWLGWQRYGDVLLAPTRRQVNGDRELSLAPIEVLESVPAERFQAP